MEKSDDSFEKMFKSNEYFLVQTFSMTQSKRKIMRNI